MRRWPLLFTLLAVAADWPMGGRTGDRNPVSPETNSPIDFRLPMDGVPAKNVKWTAKTGGDRSLGGPVISGGLVWIGTTDRDPDKNIDNAVLACYRESDGKPLYQYRSPRLPGGIDVDWPGQSLSGSPLADGDRLWFVTNRREVVCLDVGPLRRGTGPPVVLWTLDMVKTLGVKPRALMIPSADTLGSPAVYKDLLYVPTGNGHNDDNSRIPAPDAPSLVCIHTITGKVVWSDNSPGKNLLFGHTASALVIERDGRGLVVHPQGDGWVRAFDAETGKLVWKFDVNPKSARGDYGLGAAWGSRVSVVATPVYANGRVFFTTGVHPEACGDHPARLFCLDPTKIGDISPELDDGRGGGKPNPNSAVAWEYTANGKKPDEVLHHTHGAVMVTDGLAVVTDGHGVVHVLAEKTGQRQWTHDTKASVLSSSLVVGGTLYVATESGDVFAFALGRQKRLLTKVEADAPFRGSPAFANWVLYLLSEKTLYAVAKP